MSELLDKALEFAKKAHGTQLRKWTNEPYIVHPIAVMEMLKELGFHETILCAALLHDVVEDTPVTLQEIDHTFGITIARVVEDLTDVYTPKSYPNLRRKERKKLECYRLWKIGGNSKSVKLADLIDNTKSIIEHDKNFAVIYIKEKQEMLDVLEGGNPILMDRAVKSLLNAKKLLNL